ncbi:tripartite tricarboxylate transporter TctB family protein [Actinoalloteichus hymeniacidonis]|nr:tripartite tricarboxylate transporter TctB family protein [Actinoalloteichus hymeniacidonis]MBB5906632.1 putative tricarboxylic transport membrane protein [Actinoalloteichus hymeniacidonis]
MTDPEPQAGPPAERPAPSGSDRRTVLATGAFGALMVLAAALVIIDAIRLPETNAVVGPAVVPLPIGILLGLVGAILLGQSVLRLRTAPAGVQWQPKALLRLAGMVTALVAFAVLLPFLGYVVTSAGLFVAAAMLLGATHLGRMIAYGWALAAIVFLVFDRLIGLTLPTGPWGF